jgi:glycosyltransferase involved in cell wall biosynthesis
MRLKPAITSIPTSFSSARKLRLAYFVSHPIQYQAPLLKRIEQEADIDLHVFFSTGAPMRGQVDEEFGISVRWDTPLLDGYPHTFLPVLRDLKNSETPRLLRPLNHRVGYELRRGRFDALWAHGYHTLTNLTAMRAAHALRVPVLLRTDSTLDDRPRSQLTLSAKQIFFRFLKPKLSAILSVGDENTAYWKHYLGDNFPVFPCNFAVDNDYFQSQCALSAPHREELRNSLGLDPTRPVILFAAKLIARKRCADLIAAYGKLCNRSQLSALPYLLIVGSGQERQRLETLARATRPADIRFLGFQNQSQLPSFYDLCNCFVLPSTDEPWGLSVNEAMNAGRPIIVSDRVGCRTNLVHHGINGLIFTAGDIDGLAQCLQTVLEDERLAQSMGTESQRIISSYGFEQNVSGLRLALHSLFPGFPLASSDPNNAL